MGSTDLFIAPATDVLTVDYDRSGHQLTVYVTGELDCTTAPGLHDDIVKRIDADDEVVWLDLSGVTFCGSAGVSLLVRLHEHVTGSGATLRLFEPSPRVIRVLEICCLDQELATWRTPRRAAARQTS